MVHIEKHPLQWYVDKIERGESFSSLIYGDGEFYVAMGARTGTKMQYGEIVTKNLENEMAASLREVGEDIIRGTDGNLINYEQYGGRNYKVICALGRSIELLLKRFPVIDWVDGVVWEEAVRAGELGPLLRVLRDKGCMLIGNTALSEKMQDILNCDCLPVPGNNAFSEIDLIESRLAETAGPRIYVICMGLGATPLIMRLRKRPEFQGATFLDMGSVLDIFIRGSSGRGWRRELYSGPPDQYQALIDANLRELQC